MIKLTQWTTTLLEIVMCKDIDYTDKNNKKPSWLLKLEEL